MPRLARSFMNSRSPLISVEADYNGDFSLKESGTPLGPPPPNDVFSPY